jgi:mannose-6-phosphate isomerase-like protein (cupin superfamily)
MTAHLDEDLALELALGTLVGEARRAAERHAADCPRCAADVRALRETMSTMPGGLPPLPAPPAGRAALLDAITPGLPDVRRFAGFRRRFARLYDLPDAAFDDVVSGLADPSRWEAAMPTVGLYHFTPGRSIVGADAGFVRFTAGSHFPMHRHVGDEHMFIFQGGLRDEANDVTLLPGDQLVMPAGSSHDFVILPGEDCLSAVLLHGGQPEIEGFTMARK